MTATTPEAVERLIREHTDACVMAVTRQDRTMHGDAAATLRALLARVERAEAERDEARFSDAQFEAVLAERDAAIRERDDERVALNRAIELRDQEIAQRAEQLDRAEAERAAARAECARMREALGNLLATIISVDDDGTAYTAAEAALAAKEPTDG